MKANGRRKKVLELLFLEKNHRKISCYFHTRIMLNDFLGFFVRHRKTPSERENDFEVKHTFDCGFATNTVMSFRMEKTFICPDDSDDGNDDVGAHHENNEKAKR